MCRNSLPSVKSSDVKQDTNAFVGQRRHHQGYSAAEQTTPVECILPLEHDLHLVHWNFGFQSHDLVVVTLERERKDDSHPINRGKQDLTLMKR